MTDKLKLLGESAKRPNSATQEEDRAPAMKREKLDANTSQKAPLSPEQEKTRADLLVGSTRLLPKNFPSNFWTKQVKRPAWRQGPGPTMEDYKEARKKPLPLPKTDDEWRELADNFARADSLLSGNRR